MADLHLHPDGEYNKEGERVGWHGSPPEELARAILSSGLDVIVLTEHDTTLRTASRPFGDSLNVIAELERLIEIGVEISGDRREIQILLGVEYRTQFGENKEGIGQKYHLGCVYAPNSYNLSNLPVVPEERIPVQEFITGYLQQYEGISILNHPSSWDHRQDRNPNITLELMQSGLVQGVELLNGQQLALKDTNLNHPTGGLSIHQRGIRQFLQAQSSIRLASVGNSDDHTTKAIGSVATFIPGGMDIFEAIREARTKALFLKRGERHRKKIYTLLDSLGLKASNPYIDFA